MTVHLLKMCVGCDSIEDLATWQKERRAERRRAGERARSYHVTRNYPKRADEITDGGSIYWIIRGQIRVRQRITAIEPVTDKEGLRKCRLVLASKLVRTVPRPCRPMQGWRYLDQADAPADLGSAADTGAELPDKLAGELRALGLL
jgi:hypothetical protein